MSKLVDWLAAVCAFLSLWVALLYHFIEFEIVNEYRSTLSLFPVIVILAFGMYSATVVFWRVFHFNDCNKEAFELQAEIKEARTDLIAKGFVFQ